MRIGIVAGESSGDNLGAGLVAAIKKKIPDVHFEGIGGPAMIAEGVHSLFDMERLAVMGFVEPLGRLPELFAIKRQLAEKFIADPPDAFIGIDSPGFNLRLERQLKEGGVRTIHYVSPSVWAYGEKRIFKIKKAVDLMLTLFPFETEIYDKHGIPVRCIGHQLADSIAVEEGLLSKATSDQDDGAEDFTVALLPGSRAGEVGRLAPVFIAAALAAIQQREHLHFLIPCANGERLQQIERLLKNAVPDRLLSRFSPMLGQAQHAMRRSDLVLLASGTATLEALLLRRPMIVCYKLAPLTYVFASRMLKVDNISLPNLLAGRKLVPEYLQDAVTEENLQRELVANIDRKRAGEESLQTLMAEYSRVHRSIRLDANNTAASAVIEFCR